MRTLLIDVNYFPVKIIEWQKAVVLILNNRADVIEEYSDQFIRSVSLTLKLPKVLKLHETHRLSFSVKFTRLNVFHRDNFQCQYCGVKFPKDHLTFDHIIPVSRNGKTSWENVVSSCRPCNFKKGSLTPQEANMKLLKAPKKPKWSVELCLRLRDDDPVEWSYFFPTKSVA